MKKYLAGIFTFLFVIAFSSAHRCFAKETYDFSAIILIKVGKKEIKEELSGTVDVTMSEEESIWKTNTLPSLGDSSYDDSTFNAAFNFEFGPKDIECGYPLNEEGAEAKVQTFPQDNNSERENLAQNRLELDQNAMSKVVERILKKYWETIQDALDLDDCFSANGGERGRSIKFWLSRVSGMANIKDNYIELSCRGNSYMHVSNVAQSMLQKPMKLHPCQLQQTFQFACMIYKHKKSNLTFLQ